MKQSNARPDVFYPLQKPSAKLLLNSFGASFDSTLNPVPYKTMKLENYKLLMSRPEFIVIGIEHDKNIWIFPTLEPNFERYKILLETGVPLKANYWENDTENWLLKDLSIIKND